MRKSIIFLACAFSLMSCEKIWVADLQEQAYDTIRGIYDIESIVWEESEPIDINGDGVASYDYLSEWNSVEFGSYCYNAITNNRGQLSIPYVSLQNLSYSEQPELQRWTDIYLFNIEAVVEGESSHLELHGPKGNTSELTLTGYGEVTLRTSVTLKTLDQSKNVNDVTGKITIKYVRTKYWCR